LSIFTLLFLALLPRLLAPHRRGDVMSWASFNLKAFLLCTAAGSALEWYYIKTGYYEKSADKAAKNFADLYEVRYAKLLLLRDELLEADHKERKALAEAHQIREKSHR